MSDNLLFIVAPYAAALSFVSVPLVRYALPHRKPERGRATLAGAVGEPAIWRWAIAIVLLGHLLAFAFPASILIWNRRALRLFLLEGTGLAAGSLALVGLIAARVRRLRVSDRAAASSPVEVMAGTLVCLQVVSGLVIAVLYRWASSWSGVTLTPYLHSLLRLDPAVVLVADMPFVVRLHVFCAFAVVGCLPFTSMADVVIAPLRRRSESAVARSTLLCGPAWRMLEIRRTACVQSAKTMLLGDDDREN